VILLKLIVVVTVLSPGDAKAKVTSEVPLILRSVKVATPLLSVFTSKVPDRVAVPELIDITIGVLA
jgi:hypothetical protein